MEPRDPMKTTEFWMLVFSGVVLLASDSALIQIPAWVYDVWLLRFGVYAISRHAEKSTAIKAGAVASQGVRTGEFKLFVLSGALLVVNGTPWVEVEWMQLVAWMGADALANALATREKITGHKSNGNGAHVYAPEPSRPAPTPAPGK